MNVKILTFGLKTNTWSVLMVSVIIPVFNSETFLTEAVYSALALPEVGEVILVDDGSTDSSYDVCLRLQKSNSKIKVLFHEGHKNKGAAYSRNFGILNAFFPYVAFLDADDIYYPNRFLESLIILNNNAEIQGVFGKALRKDFTNNSEKIFGIPSNVSSKDLLGYILKGGYFHTNTLTVKRSFFNSVGFFNPDLWPGEEVEMWIRMAYLKGIMAIQNENPIAEYRIHGDNLSFSNHKTSRLSFWKLIFISLFFKEIGIKNRLIIIKQFIKSLIFKY